VAKIFAKSGHSVILGCRNLKKGQWAQKKLIKISGNENIYLSLIDLSSFKSIKNCADDLKNRFEKIDILINNAAIVPFLPSFTDDGLEKQIGVNYLGHFYLTNLLLPLLKKSSKVINISSRIFPLASKRKFSFEDISDYHIIPTYAKSKLCLALFSIEIAHRWKHLGIKSYTVCPGFMATNFQGNWSYMPPPFRYIPRLFMSSPDKGATTTAFLVNKAQPEKLNGKFFAKKRPIKLPSYLSNRDLSKTLWEDSLKLCQKIENNGFKKNRLLLFF